ncbi:MAG: molecular chaperone HtpG [Bacilli bacterium]|jgi:molecular chaperone HtpG|nr:molecular chaperone HtpG [Bacilli bacterium]
MKEEKEFQTESKQLLNLMINSIYSNKEIFLRELISNASDAIDKYRFLALKSEGKDPLKDGEIKINRNKDEKWIEISDDGIGMNKEELETNLGTIARSGSKEFLAKYKEMKDDKKVDLIGQFGVGFYSAFMVAKKVEVRTKALNGQGYLFTSDGIEKYTVEEIELPDVVSGSSVRVYLKDDTDDEKYSRFLEDYEIEDLVKKYSDYIRYPIKMEEVTKTPKKDAEGKEIEGQFDEVKEVKTLNSMIPLWKKAKKDVTDKELADFYKAKFGEYEDPLLSLYIKAEGLLSYDALVFIPSHAPYNLYAENYEKGLDLYSKGIFIKEKCKELIPDYLKFVKGLVDSDDLPLNISREMLQKAPVLSKIEANIEKKILERLAQLKKEDYEKYLTFFKIYGDHLKFGIYSTYGVKKDEIQDLLVFPSLNNEKPISLADYKAKMDPSQKFIYYASGKTLESIKLLPELEGYKAKNIDVLLLADSIDEFTLKMMHDYLKVEFKNISEEAKEELSQEEKDKLASLNATYKRVLDDLKKPLNGKVDEVAFSTKLVNSPVCISTKEGLSLNMEHVINEQQPGYKDENEKPKAVKVLEINASSPLFQAVSSLDNDEDIQKYGSLLYDEAMMLEGFEVEDKKAFVENLNELMLKAINKKEPSPLKEEGKAEKDVTAK